MRKVIATIEFNRKIVRFIAILAFSLAITLLTSFTTEPPAKYKLKKVVIDAGHGGKDPGTSGKFSKEKDVVLKVALMVGAYINEHFPDVEVIYTRKDDRFIELDERARIANNHKADLFISIHANAISRPTVYGTETYVMGVHKTAGNLAVAQRENSVILLEENYEERYEGFDPEDPESMILFQLYQSAFQESSLLIAQKIEEQFGTRAGRYSRGVKQAGFLVLWKTSMPSVLVEIGYLTNPKEEKELNDPSVQDYIASGIFRAFREYKNEIEGLSSQTHKSN